MNSFPLSLDAALEILAANAASADSDPIWPENSWNALRQAGVPGWTIPAEYGGANLNSVEILEGYRRLAGTCLTTCFLLSQRDAAVRRLRDSGNDILRQELLPPLARGEHFATVGLSQLTTSRQYGRPAMMARFEGDHLLLDGVMPWVTGAARADHFVTGAALDDGQQVLVVVPRETSGVTVAPPMPLAALEGSLTSEVRCQSAVLDRHWLLAGPAKEVMNVGRSSPGGLETSTLALGLVRAAADYLHTEAKHRPEWLASAEKAASGEAILWEQLLRLARNGCSSAEAAELRANANILALRTTQLALASAKGSGFLRTHPAQRRARQALFFLVWSCPRAALDGTCDQLQPFLLQ